eukprot:CAMPEP_0204302322 /NCGR_PEP_ID=MMETSP0468-20130131/81943_1 /ASSEMBLY_ACC=CAM_ASM_000383 /TAXON_ID=2969 /ORGANISM="Oxyrrhis marina" /LENGTH=42 /DNA_ID= /DNA_START= /DNA_END= /DNA_ORIENTATION=
MLRVDADSGLAPRGGGHPHQNLHALRQYDGTKRQRVRAHWRN